MWVSFTDSAVSKLRSMIGHVEQSGCETCQAGAELLKGRLDHYAEIGEGPNAGAYYEQAKEQYHSEGEVEIDDDAVVSESDEGAYVMAWVWVGRGEAGIPDEDEEGEDEEATEDA